MACGAPRNSPGCRAVRPGPVQNCSTGISRLPLGPAMTHMALWTIKLEWYRPPERRCTDCRPPTLALNRCASHQGNGVDQPRIGRCDLLMLIDPITGHCGPKGEALSGIIE